MKRSWIVDLVIFSLIVAFLFSFLTPKYIFSKSTTTGGDMGSHYPSAVYLKEVLMPAGKIMGWDQGNFAGYPLFYHYFPLAFIITALLSYVIPMQIAFKVVTILGVLLLPACVYFALRAMKYKFPIPITGAMFSLAFLFNEGNSMWGANILSTLAGEYSYSLSFALLVLLSGSLYKGIEEKTGIIRNAILVFFVGFSHGFPLIISCVIATFFLISRQKFRANFAYLFKVYGLGGLLLAFWIVPFYADLPYANSFVLRWVVHSWREYAPVILWPFAVLSVIALFLNVFDKRAIYFAYIAAMTVVMYFIGPYLGMLDIRFVPFTQVYVAIFAATFMMVLLPSIRFRGFAAFILFVGLAMWVHPKAPQVKNWVKWNYEGVEGKASWPALQEINNFLRGSGTGRVVYEHGPEHNVFGTVRIFEDIPFFTGRQTLEGLHMTASVSAPFVYYIQSQVGKNASWPLPGYNYSSLDVRAALPRMNMFNVTDYIARGPDAKAQARKLPELKLEKTVGEYEIYRVTTTDGHYVVPLAFEPVLFQTRNWKKDFHSWFINPSLLDIPLVYEKHPSASDKARFKLQSDSFLNLPRVPLAIAGADIQEKIGPEGVEFTTNLIGHPHLIRVSYHRNWKVTGADRIFLVSPSFMLVYPTSNHVRLYFGKSVFNYAGELMSLAGLAIVLGPCLKRLIRRKRPQVDIA